MSPGAGNYGSTMFEDRHRESFVDADSTLGVSPNPVVEEGQPGPDQPDLDLAAGDIAIGDTHDDKELLQDPQATDSPPAQHQRESPPSKVAGADPSEDDVEDQQRSPGETQ